MARAKAKRILIVSDLHCGHRVGLTPPGWQYAEGSEWRDKWRAIQAEAWNWWKTTIRRLGPFYAVFAIGDLIDGPGKKSGGTEQLSTDRHEQVDMAIAALRITKATRWAFAWGTPYHVGIEEDWERDVANYFEAQPGSVLVESGDHPFPRVDGVQFDLKHHPLSNPGREWTKANGLEPERITSLVWANENCRPNADIIVRGHVHTYRHLDGFSQGTGRRWDVATLPALQGMGSKYGARRCSKVVNYGLVCVDVYDERTWTWKAEACPVHSQILQPVEF